MSDNFYDTIGTILRTSLDNDEDPFEASEREQGKYRKAGGTMERRSPPKVDTSIQRVEVPPEIIEDFAVLKLLPGMPLSECKAAWKRLLKRHHPDTDTERPDSESAVIVRRINHSYTRIKTWFETGKIIDSFKE